MIGQEHIAKAQLDLAQTIEGEAAYLRNQQVRGVLATDRNTQRVENFAKLCRSMRDLQAAWKSS